MSSKVQAQYGKAGPFSVITSAIAKKHKSSATHEDSREKEAEDDGNEKTDCKDNGGDHDNSTTVNN